MFVFVCLFLPAVLSVCIYEKLLKRDLAPKACIQLYAVAAVFVNLLSWVVLRIKFAVYYFDVYDSDVLIKFLAVAVIAAAAFGVVAALLNKNVKVQVEDENKA